MSTLRPNATAAEVEEEIDFEQIRMASLDTEADDYESIRQEIEHAMERLHHRLQLIQSGRWDPTQHLAASSEVSPAGSAGTKRPASALAVDDYRTPKRQTPSPHPVANNDAYNRAQERQLRAEAAIRRNNEFRQQDEAYARKVQLQQSVVPGSSSQAVYQATLGQNGIVRPPARPSYSTSYTMPPQSSPPLLSVKAEASSRSQPLPHRLRAELVDLTGDSDDDHPPLINRSIAQGITGHSALPQPQLNGYPMPGAYPNGAGVYTPSQPEWLHQRYQPPQTPVLPSSWTTPQPGSQYVPSAERAREQHLAAALRMRNAGHGAYSSLAQYRDQAQQDINNRVSDLQQLRSLIGDGRPPSYDYEDEDSDSDVMFTGYRQHPPSNYAAHADLYRSRFEQIEQYNPEKTKEEINELLMNIRPDEDLSDDLLVSTPSEMTIKLHKYQELGLTWLQKAEENSSKGGILADDMGLGKTIQMISLIVTHKSDDPRNKTTLIVAPVALLRQWKQEIRDKVKTGRHALTVCIHHGASKKKTFQELQQFDIVITTFGSLAAELKRREKFELRKQFDPAARLNNNERCSLLDPECRWYRVILDEAQCIKNKNTQTAKAACMLKATYRFCMTGTPMMNNVGELYSLIKFLKVKPYNAWEKFNLEFVKPLKRVSEDGRENTMRKLQALCRAIMLRRTKKSKYRGKPILVLPERTTEIAHAVFDDDERAIYSALEAKTQITFNKYLRAGSVGRSYSAILVLLLRLRQACCHPHLIKDFSISAAADLSDDQLVDLARQLEPQVVDRIKATEGNFECSICMDACLNPAIFLPCGHDTCRECYVKLADPQNAIREGHEGAVKVRCPHCRGDIDPKRITDFTSFKRVHMPELLTEEEQTMYGIHNEQDGSETESEEDLDTSDDEETESEEDNSDRTLGGFIVDNDASETESEAGEADAAEELDNDAGPSSRKEDKKSRKSDKGKKGKKGKGKAKEKLKTAKQLTLAELKQQANRNVKAKRRYLRRLREDYTDSAKIRKMMDILSSIIDKNDNDELDSMLTDDIKPVFGEVGGEKILVFSQWTSLLDLCEIEIDNRGWGYRRYDGSMNAGMRADAVDDFKDNKKDVRIMLVSLKAGNAGLNLNVASQVIILDPFWNPYIEEQAIDRAHRIGQTRPVKVHRVLVESTVEDRIIELQEKKRNLIEQALDEKQASQLGRLGTQELAYLFGVTSSLNETVRDGAR